jgi:hypothetical protein
MNIETASRKWPIAAPPFVLGKVSQQLTLRLSVKLKCCESVRRNVIRKCHRFSMSQPTSTGVKTDMADERMSDLMDSERENTQQYFRLWWPTSTVSLSRLIQCLIVTCCWRLMLMDHSKAELDKAVVLTS